MLRLYYKPQMFTFTVKLSDTSQIVYTVKYGAPVRQQRVTLSKNVGDSARGSEAIVVPTPSSDEKHFNGWRDESGNVIALPSSVDGDTTVQADWAEQSDSLRTGESRTLLATISPADASDRSVTRASSDEAVAVVTGGKVTALSGGAVIFTCKDASVAGVDANGLVTALAKGETKIVVTAPNGVKASAAIKVKP